MFDLTTLAYGFGSVDLALFGLSMLIAEIYTRTKIQAVLTFQVGLKKTKRNLKLLTKKLRYDNSRSILYIGKRMYNLHHWVVGAAILVASTALIGVTTVLVNFHAIAVAAGLVAHNIIQNKKFPKFLS